MGGESMQKLVDTLAPTDLYIAKCERALFELRDRAIRRQFDRQISQGAPAYEAVNDLALAHQLTDRHVWRILKRTDNEMGQEGLF